jgi:hypothetical protein
MKGEYKMPASPGFQAYVNVQPAPAVAGDFASTNPRATVLAGPGALVAGPDGCYIGTFCWITPPPDPNGSPSLVNSFDAAGTGGPPDGFIGRNQQGLIIQYLQEAGMWIPQGFMVTVFRAGDFWVCNNGTTAATMNMQVLASPADGTASFVAAGSGNTWWYSGSAGAGAVAGPPAQPGELVKIYNKFPLLPGY